MQSYNTNTARDKTTTSVDMNMKDNVHESTGVSEHLQQ